MRSAWPHVRLKYVLDKIGSGKTPLGGSEAYTEAGVMLLRSQNVHFDGLRLDDVVFIDEETDAQMASTRIEPEDVLLNITGASLGRCAIVPANADRANVNQHVCILRSNKRRIVPSYLNMVMQSTLIQEQIFASENGSSREGLTFEQIGNFTIPLPALSEQRIVVDFLGQETAQVDALVEAKRRLLEVLAEKRQALITHAVSRGLSPDAPLRDSRIPWLGQIPEHWTVVQLKFASVSIQTGPFGSQLHAEDYVEGGIPVINPAHLREGLIVADPRVSVDEPTADRLSDHRLLPGDVVFARRGELGRCSVVRAHQLGWLCGTGSMRVRLKANAIPQYIASVFGNTGAAGQLALESVGSTMDNMNTQMLGAFQIALPPVSEQRAIVAYIESETSKMDALKGATKSTIDLLKERRSALISAAVTGELEVN